MKAEVASVKPLKKEHLQLLTAMLSSAHLKQSIKQTGSSAVTVRFGRTASKTQRQLCSAASRAKELGKVRRWRETDDEP
ncbi:MAG TPA: hypothetical protein PLD20_07625 [Blastocatellia bacterium]|nr:hypothetical protein [Blastocatellia bacterium]HMV86826.1 hypothetical protein [Blastocatellia bacterium]HMX29493.1 hypothetical protein [Blastocatellia bacterium]HMZ17781.1 hypothetical protein [Blastocatellia bacterium]HNG30805.1 hypothetical protein [Blastocatellia bacterium]